MTLRRLAAADSDPHDYLEGANRAFGAWGDEATFAWVFRGDAELLLVEDGGRIVAGAGITRRRLTTGQPIAIMTGAWTSAEARGRGAFTGMVEESCAIARERGAVFLGFVRAGNASRRVLEQMGAALHTTFYCRSTTIATPVGDLRTVDADAGLFASSFAYTPAEWRVQFLERPHAEIECVGVDGRAAVVERTLEFDRVHAVSDERLLPHLAARAHAGGRRLFWYSTTAPAIECEWTEGFLATLPPLACDWQLQNGDRM
jgi:ribosomal protein S18 acetylase RimI-like enzyme